MNHTPYKAIFFDLDGTLLPMDLDEFMHKYMSSIGQFAHTNGMNMELFSQGLHGGIRAMATDDSSKSNASVFWDSFFSVVPEDRQTWIPLFNEFYENHFGEIGEGVVANPYAAQSIDILQDKGYPLVLATMPMFPQRAVEWRCEWSGIDPDVFKRITNFENSTSVKPKLAYYRENLKAAELKPQDVLMVGNNTKEDLACLELGMDAYLITDHLINENNFDLDSVKHGSFQEFKAWVEALDSCENPAESFVTSVVAN